MYNVDGGAVYMASLYSRISVALISFIIASGREETICALRLLRNRCAAYSASAPQTPVDVLIAVALSAASDDLLPVPRDIGGAPLQLLKIFFGSGSLNFGFSSNLDILDGRHDLQTLNTFIIHLHASSGEYICTKTMATEFGVDGSPLKPQDNHGVTSASTNESPPLAIDAPSALPSLAPHHSQGDGHVSDQDASGIDADSSSVPVQSSTPADDDAELEWTPDPDPMTPDSLLNEETVAATGTSVEVGAFGGDTAREAPLSPVESGAAVSVGSRELQSPDASARYTQDPEPHVDPPVSESVQPEQSPRVYGFVPDEPLEVDERLLRYAASRANVSASHAVDSQSWIPEDFLRQPTGSTIAEPESVLGRSGRTYHGFKEGKYFMPNDGVSCTAFNVSDS